MEDAIQASYKAAQKLDTIGMAVILEEDNGQLTHTKLTSLPWTLGHGPWVVKVEGRSGGYDCARIRPATAQDSSPATATLAGRETRLIPRQAKARRNCGEEQTAHHHPEKEPPQSMSGSIPSSRGGLRMERGGA